MSIKCRKCNEEAKIEDELIIINDDVTYELNTNTYICDVCFFEKLSYMCDDKSIIRA